MERWSPMTVSSHFSLKYNPFHCGFLLLLEIAWPYARFMHLLVMGEAEIAKSNNDNGCQHTFASTHGHVCWFEWHYKTRLLHWLKITWFNKQHSNILAFDKNWSHYCISSAVIPQTLFSPFVFFFCFQGQVACQCHPDIVYVVLAPCWAHYWFLEVARLHLGCWTPVPKPFVFPSNKHFSASASSKAFRLYI